MKTKIKLLMLTVIVSLGLQLKAQITLDRDITESISGMGYDFYLAHLSPSETKYVFLDTLTNTFNLYNMDFTPFMENISVPEPFISGNVFMQPIYISRTLFDCDSTNIEYAYQSATNVRKPFRILRTDGTVLFQKDSANGIFCTGGCLGYSDIVVPIRKTSAGTKLFLQHYDDNQGGQRHILVYSLCGELPNDIFDFTPFNRNFVELFPNPSSSSVNFKISPPDNMSNYELVIFDTNGKRIITKQLTPQNYNYSLEVTGFSSGSYNYSLCTKNKVFQTGKFILTK